ncbi:hypothetical protein RMSM_00847 [Rhodopirellula maiorica SM1]|uniref:Uncharacterized protein n=1 Tax=Rhodopirellula maiorica SM1 TaxID=1265738 RepID=M5RS99_9BACT|nr:hypothetical protein RMSM_00847 [Rhodopirellula maiorica SM1]
MLRWRGPNGSAGSETRQEFRFARLKQKAESLGDFRYACTLRN